jgi:hypothetical protein
MSVVKIIKDLFISLRPKQWIKNSFVLAAVFFVREFSNVTQVLSTPRSRIGYCSLCQILSRRSFSTVTLTPLRL